MGVLSDLASRLLGATVVAASDESFGDKEHLLNPADPDFRPGRYDHRGEIVDGWETRRRRSDRDPDVPGTLAGLDWVVVRLGVAGRIHEIDVDTTSFTGNAPVTARVEALGAEGYPAPSELGGALWTTVVAEAPLRSDAHNVFPVLDAHRYTHVRLLVRPDGGVARLRVRGIAIPDPREIAGVGVDLLSAGMGSVVVAASDGFYSPPDALLLPDVGRTMGEGWETRRRRDGGHDWALIRLGVPGVACQVVVDTRHFRYNASSAVTVLGWTGDGLPSVPDPSAVQPPGHGEDGWTVLLDRFRLQPDTVHVVPLTGATPVTVNHVRLHAFPDGGLSRVRLPGHIPAVVLQEVHAGWLAALPSGQLELVGPAPVQLPGLRRRDDHPPEPLPP